MKEITRRLGIEGKAYDLPGTRRAYTYRDQPDNVAAWRIGQALIAAKKDPAGDLIDSGMALLKRLQEMGFGVFETDEAAARAAGGE